MLAYAGIQIQRYPASFYNTHTHTHTQHPHSTHTDKTNIANEMKKCIVNDNTL